MENDFDKRRKSSCATVVAVPSHKNHRKLSTPLTLNSGDNEFYDTGSITDVSLTTAVSSKTHSTVHQSSPPTLFSSIKTSVFNLFKCKVTKTNENEKPTRSYMESHLSPGSTAVSSDIERQGYFGTVPAKKKRSPRRWIAAILMIVVGALIAITFVLVGLGKALGGTNTVAQNSTAVASVSSTTLTITSFIQPTSVHTHAQITLTVTSASNPTPT